MRDCANVAMRDLLPDLLHDRLPAALRAEVTAHVAGCADCRAELAILRSVVAMSVVPRVDAARIAAALPSYRATSRWRRLVVSPAFRIAAAIALLVGGAGVIAVVARQRDAKSPEDMVQAPLPKSSAPAVPLSTSVPPAATPEVAVTPAPKPRTSPPGPAELALGESFHDLTDSELRALLAEMERFEAMTPSETEIVVPSPGRGAQ